jgi:hypothetical protein
MEIEMTPQLFVKISSIKFHQGPSIGSRSKTCGRTDRQIITYIGSVYASLGNTALSATILGRI